jgi:lysophospholipase L1-like esterase
MRDTKWLTVLNMKKAFKILFPCLLVVSILLSLVLPVNISWQGISHEKVFADTITMGSASTDRASLFDAGLTYICLTNPSSGNGTLTSVDIWASVQDMASCYVSTAYLVSGTTYHIRDSESLGAVVKGASRNFTVSLTVSTGDYLALYFTTTGSKVEADTSGGSGVRWISGNHINTGDEANYTNLSASSVISLYASGTTTSVGTLTVTTANATSVEETTATANGNITELGSSNATVQGFEYDTDSGAPYSFSANNTGNYGIGAYTVSLTGLTQGEVYYGRAFASDGSTTVYGSEVSFITKPEGATNFVSTGNTTRSLSFSWTNGTGMDYVEARYSYVAYPTDNNTAAGGALAYWGTGNSFTISGLSSNYTMYVSLITHAYSGGLWSTADTIAEVSDKTDSRTYPAYAPYGASKQVVMIGDSLIQGKDYPNYTIAQYFTALTGYTVWNKGSSGQTTTQILARFNTDVIANNPRIVVMEGGANDIYGGGSKSTFLSNWTSMLDTCQASANISLMIVQTITPASSINAMTADDWNNSLISLVSGYSKAVLVDARPYMGVPRAAGTANNLWDINAAFDWGDGVHFNAAGNQIMAQAFTGGIPDTEGGISAPTVVTSDATNVEETSATLNGEVTDYGGENVTRGFNLGTSTGVYDTENWTDTGTFGNGTYSHSVTVQPGTEYFFITSANNTAGTGNGAEKKFLTKPNSPSGIVLTPGTGQITIAWDSVSGAGTYMVRGKQGEYPTDYADGVEVYSGTGINTTHTGLGDSETWFYRVWSKAAVDALEQWSDSYAGDTGTTDAPTTTTTTTTTSPPAGSLGWTGGAGIFLFGVLVMVFLINHLENNKNKQKREF